jgi:hypothetical protein
MATVSKQTVASRRIVIVGKRIGRPFKTPPKGKRAPLSLLVRPTLKRLIDQRAQVNGRTQSAEAEAMLERLLALEETLETMRTDLSEIERGSIDAVLRRRGHKGIGSPYGVIWFPPGYPKIEHSRFDRSTNPTNLLTTQANQCVNPAENRRQH